MTIESEERFDVVITIMQAPGRSLTLQGAWQVLQVTGIELDLTWSSQITHGNHISITVRGKATETAINRASKLEGVTVSEDDITGIGLA